VNPHHGSEYDEYGVKYGGPAPASLAGWDALVNGDRVLVGSARTVPPIPAHVGQIEPPRWQCLDGDPVTFHTFSGWRVWSPREVVGASPHQWVVIAGQLQRVGDGVLLCSLSGCNDSARVEGVTWPPPTLPPGMQQDWSDPVWLARVRDGEIIDLTRIIRPANLLPKTGNGA